MPHMQLMPILKLKEDRYFSSPDCSEQQLRSMMMDCESYQGGANALQATQAIQAIRDELVRREAMKVETAAAGRHSAALEHDRRLHQKTQHVAWIAVVAMIPKFGWGIGDHAVSLRSMA